MVAAIIIIIIIPGLLRIKQVNKPKQGPTHKKKKKKNLFLQPPNFQMWANYQWSETRRLRLLF